MSDPIFIISILVVAVALLIVAAPRISQTLVRWRARRLPLTLSLRMEEEWLGELRATSNRAGKLAFAVALVLTRRRAFVTSVEEVSGLHDHRVSIFANWKSLMMFSTAGFALTAFALSFLLPVRFASDALFLIRPSDVPEEVVHGMPKVAIADRVKLLRDQIRSRPVMAHLAREFEGVLFINSSKSMDERVEQMRRNIEITSGSPETSLELVKLRYIGSDPKTVQRVASKLVDLVMKRDSEARESRFRGTEQFLSAQLDRLVVRIREQNDRLSAERSAHGNASVAALVLEYEMLETTYRTLFTKLEEARMSLALEFAQRGGSIEVLDPPNLGLPVGPDRLSITVIGALTGFGLSGVAVFGLSRKRPRVLA